MIRVIEAFGCSVEEDTRPRVAGKPVSVCTRAPRFPGAAKLTGRELEPLACVSQDFLSALRDR